MRMPLGRIEPNNFDHVKTYGYSPAVIDNVEKSLDLPVWHWSWDQGKEGACVGFGTSMMMSILNKGERYAARWLWQTAKSYDGIDQTEPGDSNGTTVSGACDVLRLKGHRPMVKGLIQPETPADGIKTNSWATNSDQIRTAISEGIPISIGVNWYTSFDKPVEIHQYGDLWIGDTTSGRTIGTIRGGHCVCIYGASDKRQGFAVKNSWGKAYPLVWLPYSTMDRLLQENGEATLVTDK